MDPSLLYLEVPIFGNNSYSRVHEIVVDEGNIEDLQDIQDVNFPDCGGGIDFNIKELDISKSFYWRTSGNSLELTERSLNINLHQNDFRIEFKNSKVLPNVEIACNNGQILILFATIHAAHRLKFNIGQNKNRSIFHNLLRSCFNEDTNNYYFNQVESIDCFTFDFTTGRGNLGALFAFVTASGNIVQVKMPYKGTATVSHMNKASRISRIWSGINPWAGTGTGESPCDIVMVNMNDPKLVGVCKDRKLRIWSAKSQECVAQWDMSEYLKNDIDAYELTGHDHKIRTVCNENGRFLSVFYSCGSNLMFLNIKINTETCTYTYISTVQYSPDVMSASLLVDYKLSMQDQLWTLWLDSEDQMTLSVCEINKLVWNDVALNSTLPTIEEMNVPQHLSIREFFLEKVFASGSFSASSITKALSIYQRSSMGSQKIKWKSLREVVTRAIEEEIQSVLERSEGFTSEELIQVQFSTYQSFYQTLCQYQLKLAKPLGISVPSNDGVKVIKKDNISHLVSVSNLEAVCRGADPSLFEKILPSGSCYNDLSKLLRTLSLLANILGQDYLDSALQLICFSENPVESVRRSLNIIGQIIRERSENFELENSYAAISDVVSAVQMLMTCLEPGALQENEILRESRSDFLNGDEGLELVVRSLQRYVNDRLQLSMLLLILSMLFNELRDTYPTRISVYVQAYKAIQWIVMTELQPSSNSSIESTMRMLSVDSDLNSNSEENSLSLLIEYFLRSEGGKLLGSMLSNTYSFRGKLNNSIVSEAVGTIAKILWSLGPTIVFPEFLLSKCQFSMLLHYIDFELNSWCNFCPGYMKYMTGHCHLHAGNYIKAVHTFIQASEVACNESLFVSRVLKIEEDQYTTDQIEVLYFTKILEYFEKLNLSEHVIILAKYAIGKADDSSVSILCCSIFRQSLVLGRNIEAYNAILMNPEYAHKKDCLRSMVVTLCERKHYKTLVEHSYEGMNDDLVSILEHRARCSDILTSPHDYYGLLFSFNMHRANYRRAASSMYEQSCRLKVELSGPNILGSLKRQRVCLVSTITCLQLVDKDYQWIVHPITALGTNLNLGGKSPKRDSNGDFISDIDKRNVVIVKLSDVRKENRLAETRIKIIEDSKDESMLGPVVNATETISLLNHCGLYRDAFYVSSQFDLSPENIFESLTTKCIKASYTNDEENYLSWLSKNDQSSGLNDNYSNVSDLSWRLLRKFLADYSDTKNRGSINYRAVVKTILSYNCQIPAWLLNDYKKLNCPELLRMLYCYDYLELATSVSIEFVSAVMGCGPEHFNIKATLQSTGASVWLPYNEIERLLILLEDLGNEDKYLQMHKNLSDKMNEYFDELERVNSGMMQYRTLY